MYWSPVQGRQLILATPSCMIMYFMRYMMESQQVGQFWRLLHGSCSVQVGRALVVETAEVVPLRVEVDVAVPDLTPAEW